MNKVEKNNKAKKIIAGTISIVFLLIVLLITNHVIQNSYERFPVSLLLISLWFAGMITISSLQRGDVRNALHNRKNLIFFILFTVIMCMIVFYVVKKLPAGFIAGLVIMIAVVSFIAGCLTEIALERKRIGLAKAYVILATLFGLSFDFVLPVGMVPDEWSHLDTAYLLSNEMLGYDETKNPKDVMMRKDDAEFEIMQTDVSIEDYEKYLSSYTDPLTDDSMVSTKSRALEGNEYLYVIPACGIAIGRLLRLNSFMVINLGRLFNLIFYVFMTAIAVHLIPVGKWILILTSWMPTALQQNMSYSYDVPVNAFALLVIAVSVKMLTDDEYRPPLFMWLLTLAGIFVLFMAKSHAYFLLAFLPVFVIAERNLKISQEKKDKLMKWTAVLILVLVALTLIFFFSGMALKVIPESHRMVDWRRKKEGYTLWYFARNPMQLIVLPLQTVRWQISTYFTSYFGKWMGWFEINTGNAASLIFLAFMILAIISENKKIEKKDGRIFFWLVGLGVILCVFGGFLLSYSTLSKPYIEGVQGRYLIPPVTLILVTAAGSLKKRTEVPSSIYLYGSCFVSSWTLIQILLWYVSAH